MDERRDVFNIKGSSALGGFFPQAPFCKILEKLSKLAIIKD